ncbi:MAG: hypothetical protein H6672_02730 [Anaerolineaceae bacterium]|nr:hypothetical protein [Anaerolineaceae bacterium]
MMSAEWNLSDRDYELLSAYLDGVLVAADRAALEKRLAAEPALRAELDALQDTISLLNQLPTHRAPRDFTLTPAMIGSQTTSRRGRLSFLTSPTFSAVTAAAAMFLVVLGAFLGMQQGSFAPQTQSAGDSVAIQTTNEAAVDGVLAGLPTSAGESSIQQNFITEEAAPGDSNGVFRQEVTGVPLSAVGAVAAPTQIPQGTLMPPAPSALMMSATPLYFAPGGVADDEGSVAASDAAGTGVQNADAIPQTALAEARQEAETVTEQVQMVAPVQPTVIAALSPTPPPTMTAPPTATTTPPAVVDNFAQGSPSEELQDDGSGAAQVAVQRGEESTPLDVPAGDVLLVIGLVLLAVAGVTTVIRRRS